MVNLKNPGLAGYVDADNLAVTRFRTGSQFGTKNWPLHMIMYPCLGSVWVIQIRVEDVSDDHTSDNSQVIFNIRRPYVDFIVELTCYNGLLPPFFDKKIPLDLHIGQNIHVN